MKLAQRGFTLVEVILVALVLTLLLVAAVPRFVETSQRLRAERTAFEFAQLLRYAHARAVAQGQPVVWTWEPERRRAALGVASVGDPQEGPVDCADGELALAPDRESASVPEGVDVSVEREDRAADCVSFFPDGTSDPATLHVVHRQRDYTLTVDAQTGQVLLSTRAAPR